ncbi:MAG TPA: DNA double-strand break repair nuclease NurA [Ktedonobacterales bacterium]|nr:DNA double-strand break repair nuclease NurA [Ktedonobacterales bacterium]
MLYTHKLLAELEAKAERLAGFQDDYGRRLEAYRAALVALGARYPTAKALARAQRELLADESAGAAPTAEYDAWRARGAGGVPLLPFGTAFAHHAEARAWAEGLRGVTTFAVDGSQLLPWRDASVPLALVQVGIFENPHQPPAPYVKDIALELLTPDDLLGSGRPDPAAGDDDGSGLADDDAPDGAQIASEETVHLRRFQLEARALVERMERHARREGADEGLVVGLLDGSLIVSFALKMSPAYRTAYVSAARSLLDASARCRVPLVAYIDTSYARDVVGMLRHLAPDALPDVSGPRLPAPRGIHDALLWQGALAWGDRTPAFLSARGDVLAGGYGEAKGDIACVYLQTALARPPARLEFPHWMLKAGLLDRVLDAVRAEVIAGNGYPYPLEAADAVAVIALADRAQFYQIFQRFAQERGLAFSFSRKALSKNRRRV